MRRKKSGGRGGVLACVMISMIFAIMMLMMGTTLVFGELTKSISRNGMITEGSGSEAVEVAANTETWHWYETENTEEVRVTTEDGIELVGTIYRQADKGVKKWAIVVHGYTGNKEAMRGFARRYYEAGYNVLTPDMRAHGESGGEYSGMGWLDRLDIQEWIRSIHEMTKKPEIIMHGVSVGAAAVLMSSGEELGSSVKAIIEEGSYTSVWEIMSYRLKNEYRIPRFPVMYGANIWGRMKWGYDWKEASALEQVKRSRIPTLFIHGGGDTFVPTSMGYELYQAANCEKRLLIIEGAAHGSCSESDPDRYWESVFSFINGYQ